SGGPRATSSRTRRRARRSASWRMAGRGTAPTTYRRSTARRRGWSWGPRLFTRTCSRLCVCASIFCSLIPSLSRWPLVQRQDTRLWIWVWWFESTGANSPPCTAFTHWRWTDGFASDPDDGPPGAPHAGAGSPVSSDGVLRPPRVRGRPVSPLPGVRPLLLHGIAALARHSVLARRGRARRRWSAPDPSGLGRRRPPECRSFSRDHRLPTDAGGVGLDGDARASCHRCA